MLFLCSVLVQHAGPLLDGVLVHGEMGECWWAWEWEAGGCCSSCPHLGCRRAAPPPPALYLGGKLCYQTPWCGRDTPPRPRGEGWGSAVLPGLQMGACLRVVWMRMDLLRSRQGCVTFPFPAPSVEDGRWVLSSRVGLLKPKGLWPSPKGQGSSPAPQLMFRDVEQRGQGICLGEDARTWVGASPGESGAAEPATEGWGSGRQVEKVHGQ